MSPMPEVSVPEASGLAASGLAASGLARHVEQLQLAYNGLRWQQQQRASGHTWQVCSLFTATAVN